MRIVFLLLATALFASRTTAEALSPRTAALSQASASSASDPTSPTSSFISSPTFPTTDSSTPQITEAPEILLGDVSLQLQEKYHQTTYWSCVTIATQSHCGWHEPILPGGDEIPAGGAGRLGAEGKMGSVLGLVAAVVGLLMR